MPGPWSGTKCSDTSVRCGAGCATSPPLLGTRLPQPAAIAAAGCGSRSGELREMGRAASAIHRIATLVDDVGDLAAAVERAGHGVPELDPGSARRLDRAVQLDRRVVVEEAVDAEPPGLMAGDAVRHLVGGEAV